MDEGAPVVTPASDDIRSLAMVLACVESVGTERQVDVEALLAG